MDPTDPEPAPPGDPDPDPAPPEILPPVPTGSSREVEEPPGIAELIAGTVSGLILFCMAGGLALNVLRNQTALTLYLMFCGAAGASCCFKPRLRGLGFGILLGLGAVLLLVAMCSGMHV